MVVHLLLLVVLSSSTQNNPITGDPIIPIDTRLLCSIDIIANMSSPPQSPVSSSFFLPESCNDSSDWGYIVLTLSSSVRGVQYDRIGAVYLNNIQILKTTTPEPTIEGIQWSIRKDITLYGSLLLAEKPVLTVNIGNYVDPTYNGTIYSSASIEIYQRGDFPVVFPEILLPELIESTDVDSVFNFTVSLPFSNAVAAYLDVFASGHGNEEFWYANPPSWFAHEKGVPGGGAYRQFMIFIDDMFAGSLFPFPVIYTGGINPLLWKPLTGIFSFDIPAYRFDLTPFAGILNDRSTHNVTFLVLNATGKWNLSPSLAIYQDPNAEELLGTVKSLYDPPAVDLTFKNMSESGEENVLFAIVSMQNYEIIGSLNYSDGRVMTSRVKGTLSSNNFNYFDEGITYGSMEAEISVSIQATDGSLLERDNVYHYPYYMNSSYNQNNDTMEIDALVQYGRYRDYKESFKSNHSSTQFSLHWENTMNSYAVYNRTLDHKKIYKYIGDTSEIFSINKENQNCYMGKLSAKNGAIETNNASKFICEFPSNIHFCSGELCFRTNEDIVKANEFL